MAAPLDLSRDFSHIVDVQSGAAGAAVTATLAAVPGRTVWVVGFCLTTGLPVAAVGGSILVGPVLDEATGTNKTLAFGFDILTTGLIFPYVLPDPMPGPVGVAVQAALSAITGGPTTALVLYGLVV